MTNQQHIEKSLEALESKFGKDAIYDFLSGFHDVIALGHTSKKEDNPHDPNEQPSYALYQHGAVSAEKLIAQLDRNARSRN
jgi:hypothetical protein